jgi:hypothetical protein
MRQDSKGRAGELPVHNDPRGKAGEPAEGLSNVVAAVTGALRPRLAQRLQRRATAGDCNGCNCGGSFERRCGRFMRWDSKGRARELPVHNDPRDPLATAAGPAHV